MPYTTALLACNIAGRKVTFLVEREESASVFLCTHARMRVHAYTRYTQDRACASMCTCDAHTIMPRLFFFFRSGNGRG